MKVYTTNHINAISSFIMWYPVVDKTSPCLIKKSYHTDSTPVQQIWAQSFLNHGRWH